MRCLEVIINCPKR